jgi:hypothetical protein
LVSPAYLRDGVHFTPAGYDRFAANIKSEILAAAPLIKGAALPWIAAAALLVAVGGYWWGARR